MVLKGSWAKPQAEWWGGGVGTRSVPGVLLVLDNSPFLRVLVPLQRSGN